MIVYKSNKSILPHCQRAVDLAGWSHWNIKCPANAYQLPGILLGRLKEWGPARQDAVPVPILANRERFLITDLDMYASVQIS
jgi:hypothetical protein